MRDGYVKVASATPEIRVADTQFNLNSIINVVNKAYNQGVKLIALPELCLTGYSCGDLFFQSSLLDGALDALNGFRRATEGMDILCFVGLPVVLDGRLYNCAAAVQDGSVIAIIPKTNIPNYGEFYEKRYFASGDWLDDYIGLFGEEVPFATNIILRCRELPEFTVAAEICEDLWIPSPPSSRHARAGATVIVNLSASNESVGKAQYRSSLVTSQSARLICGYIYSDAGKGESTTDLVYLGHDIIAENGEALCSEQVYAGMVVTELDIKRLDFERRRMGVFEADTSNYRQVEFSLEYTPTGLTREISATPFVPGEGRDRLELCEKILTIQTAGLVRRMEHTGSKYMVIGVSGGLDSTLALIVCIRAADMLGMPRERVAAVTMPCFGTTDRTKNNAVLLAQGLGAQCRQIDIGASVMKHFEDIGHDPGVKDVVFENAQARERTQALMDIANEIQGLVVGTGDMSELALGWATYGGDHMSMYGVNSGVPKTLVRHLVDYYAQTCVDTGLEAVLRDVLATPVSPELLPAREGEISQKTEDLVGPYELHDFFLYYLIRWGFSSGKTLRCALYAFKGRYDEQTIKKWLKTFISRFFAQQFKRSCMPDGPKIGTLSLSPRGDWRMPSDASARLWLSELDNNTDL